MKTYTVALKDGQTFHMCVDMVDAAAPISANFHDLDDDCWQQSPFQTADAYHNAHRAAALLAKYFRASPDDCVEVDHVCPIEHAA